MWLVSWMTYEKIPGILFLDFYEVLTWLSFSASAVYTEENIIYCNVFLHCVFQGKTNFNEKYF